MSFFDAIVMLVVLVIASFFGLFFSVPLTGALIRFRANYTPKALQLDGEGNAQPFVGPVIPNYFAMFLRVKRIEGWPGLWKGYVPTLLSSLITVIFAIAIVGATMSYGPGGAHSPMVDSSFHLVLYAGFLALLSTPMTVLINRAITTPHRLPWFAPKKALQILLTPYELHRPWALYLAPGLLLSRTLHIFWLVFIQRGVRRLLLPTLDADKLAESEDPSNIIASLSPIGLGFYIFFVGVSAVVVLTPLEVISTRLSIQRNNSQSAGFGSVPDEALPDLEYAGQDEDVIALRPEDDPYEGFVHCGKSILQEEGPEALLRAWWITLIAGLFGAFS